MRGVVHELQIPAGLGGTTTEGVKQAIASQFWDWFDNHQNDVIYTVKVWIINRAIRVRDVRVIFERLFGSHP